MSQHLYQVASLIEQSFLQKLFKQHPEENAVIELNNLLATKPVKQIQAGEIEGIEERYKISLREEFCLNMEEFYAVYLNHCLADKALSRDEVENLQHLKNLLSLDNAAVEKLHVRIGEQIYQQSFEKAIANGRLTPEKENSLLKLERELQLPKSLTEKISKEARTAFMENFVSQIIRDERLSPSEEKELHEVAASLKIQLQVDSETQKQLDKLKRYWALENLELPIVQTDITLNKAEQCYVCIPNTKWHELRSVRQQTSYAGYSTSFRVAKGFYLRSGSSTPRSYSVGQMTLIDSGTLYLTNKRIIFTGSKKNSNIRLEKILNIKPYIDGVEIGKDTGKIPLLQFNEKADVFCIILERLLRERAF